MVSPPKVGWKHFIDPAQEDAKQIKDLEHHLEGDKKKAKKASKAQKAVAPGSTFASAAAKFKADVAHVKALYMECLAKGVTAQMDIFRAMRAPPHNLKNSSIMRALQVRSTLHHFVHCLRVIHKVTSEGAFRWGWGVCVCACICVCVCEGAEGGAGIQNVDNMGRLKKQTNSRKVIDKRTELEYTAARQTLPFSAGGALPS